LAEQIVSLQNESHPQVKTAMAAVAGSAPRTAATLAREKTEECANCGQAFGRLQQRAAWMGHSVCPACHAKLAGEIAAVEQAAAGRKSAAGDFAEPNRLAQPSSCSAQVAQKVAVRRVPEPSTMPDPARSLARSAQAAGRMALAVGMGTLAKTRGTPLVQADAGGQSGLAVRGEPDARLRTAPPSLQNRLFFVLVILTLTGVAVYGALTLLQALAGYLTAAAFILLAVVGAYLLLRLSLSASRRLLPIRSTGRAGQPSTVQKSGA
jgi:hypothetical protein